MRSSPKCCAAPHKGADHGAGVSMFVASVHEAPRVDQTFIGEEPA